MISDIVVNIHFPHAFEGIKASKVNPLQGFYQASIRYLSPFAN